MNFTKIKWCGFLFAKKESHTILLLFCPHETKKQQLITKN